MYGTQRGTGYGYSLWEFKVYGTSTGTPPPTGGPGWVMAPNPVTGVTPSTATPPATNPPTTHHEFQANCSVSRTNLPDDPIVFSGCRAPRTRTRSWATPPPTPTPTLSSLQAGGTACITPGDKTGVLDADPVNNGAAVQPVGRQVIYYKSGVHRLRAASGRSRRACGIVVGSPTSTLDEFQNHPGAVEGWECGDS